MKTNRRSRLGLFLAVVLAAACVQAPTTKPPKIKVVVNRVHVEGDLSFLPPAKNFVSAPRQVKEFAQENQAFMILLEATGVPAGPNQVFTYNDELLAIMRFINDEGNTRVTWKDDKFTWGVTEKWAFPKLDEDGKLYEDCEGIALWKFREFAKLGVPSSPLLITLVDVGGQGHAVLVVRTNQGDFVLDNAYKTIRTVKAAEDAGYVFMQYPLRGSEFDGTWARTYKQAP